MPAFKIDTFRGGISDYEDKGISGAFKFAKNLDIRKFRDTLSAGQALVEEGVTEQSASPSISPSASRSPSASASPSPSRSVSPSASASPSPKSPSASVSPSASRSPSASASPSASVSPSSSVSPSPSPSTGLNSVFHDLIIAFVKAIDGKTYGFGRDGKIYKRNSDAYWVQVYDQRAQITGACEKPSHGGKVYLEWCTRTEIHRKRIDDGSNWNNVDAAGTVQGDTWPKTNLQDSDYHTMVQVSGDVLITNGPYLAMSAYDDSYTNEALDLIPGRLSKAIVERNGNAVIGTYPVGDPDQGVNGMVDTEIPIVQKGENGDIFYADFNNSIAVKQIPGGGKVNPYGIGNDVAQAEIFSWQNEALSWIDKQAIGNMGLLGIWGGESGYGGVYTFGRKYKNQPLVLNLEYAFDADEIGAVVNVNGLTLFSYKEGSTYGVMAEDPNNKAVGTYEGLDLKAPIKLPAKLVKYDMVELYMAPLPTGCSVEFWYRIDKSGAFVRAKTVDGQNSYSTASSKKAVFRIGEEGKIFEPRVVLNPYGNATPEVYRILLIFT